MKGIPNILFTREHATMKMFSQAERWFNKLSVTGQLDAIYDAWVVNRWREQEKPKKEQI